MSFAPDPLIYETYVIDIQQIARNNIYIKYRAQLNLRKFYKVRKIENSQKEAKNIIQKERVFEFIWDYKNKIIRTPIFSVNTTEITKDHFVQFLSGLRPVENKIKAANL